MYLLSLFLMMSFMNGPIEEELAGQKTRITEAIKSSLLGEAEKEVLLKNQALRLRWGAVKNRTRNIKENRTAAAVSQALEEFQGMTVINSKASKGFLEQLGIHLDPEMTNQDTTDPVTGERLRTDEGEIGHISTWVDQDKLVINIIEVKTSDVKPWAPEKDQKKRAEAAVCQAMDGLEQIVKDFKTFKMMFPDIAANDWEKLR